jgi:conjugative relaxase-like TrwC/TraI family protein
MAMTTPENSHLGGSPNRVSPYKPSNPMPGVLTRPVLANGNSVYRVNLLAMLSPRAQYSVGDAKKYFREHLSLGDYYTEGQRVPGQWYGKGAEALGLSGVTTEGPFVRLCDNLHPQTGRRLTQRQNTNRTETGVDGLERETANRRVFYDFTFSPPKSVSIAALAGDDARIVRAHEEAVAATLNELQALAATRVRSKGQCADRPTSNIVAAIFRHDTSRALDPHLHSHCIVFNATFDPVERRWKALQNHDMLQAQKFIESVYYHELARELTRLGYRIENRLRGDFELQGLASELIEKFSKRHRQIDQKTQEVLARRPEASNGAVAAIRENIAHRERPPKVGELGLPQLQRLWDNQMTPAERRSLRGLTVNEGPSVNASAMTAEQAVAWAEEHLFERRSLVHEHELWRHALEHARGQGVSLGEIQAATRQRGYLRDERNPSRVTLREHLQREWEIICAAKEGRFGFGPFCPDPQPDNPQLDEEQHQAVRRLLKSPDFITLFRGGAGTGKSFTLREVERRLREAGYSVQVLAPQRQQVMGLQGDGFENVATLSALLARGQLPRRSVLLVDEAGQIGGKQMHALLALAQESGARVILSGDTRQHGAVEASDALRAIEKHSGLAPVELTNIRRQNPALAKTLEERERIKEYRQAVAEARDGKLAQSFDRLEKLGAIEQCAQADQRERLAARYLALTKTHQSCVVVSQSWNEIHRVNEAIRLALKGQGLLGEAETKVTALQPLDLTEAQKRDARSYGSDTVLVFNRNLRGFRAGESVRMKSIGQAHLIVEGESRIAMIGFKHLDRLTACHCQEMALSPGDRLQLKANGCGADHRKLANGELVTVQRIDPDGRVVLTDGRILDKGYRQFVHGYAVTSYASQGKSVDQVLFSDSALKAATNQQQWYVTISRGKRGVHIFTADKAQLRENITRSGERPLAVECVSAQTRRSWFSRLVARRWGERMARVLDRRRRARIAEALRRRAMEQVERPRPERHAWTPRQSRGVRV